MTVGAALGLAGTGFGESAPRSLLIQFDAKITTEAIALRRAQQEACPERSAAVSEAVGVGVGVGEARPPGRSLRASA